MVKRKIRKKWKKIDWRYNLGEYWDAMRNWKGLALALFLSILVVELLNIVPSFLFKEFVDGAEAFAGGALGLSELQILVLMLAGVYILANAAQIVGFWSRNWVAARLELRMMTYMKNKYLNHLVGLDNQFHVTHKTGSLISRMTRGISSVERLTDVLIYAFLGSLIQVIAVGFSIAYFDLVSGIVIVGILVAFAGYSLFVQRRRQPYKIASNDAEDIEKAGLSDVLTNIDSIKYFGREKWIKRMFGRLTQKTEKDTFDYWKGYGWLISGQVGIVTLGTVVLLTFPIIRFLSGDLSLGEVVFIYTIYRTLMGPMWEFVSGFENFHRSLVDFQDLFHYGKLSSKIQDRTGAKALNVKKGEIEFRDIDFGYKKNRKIFEDFDLVIPAKSKVAFVGHSGCGKSTLVNLLYRFYDVDKGAVMIDGVDVRDVKQESLRGEMSIVPQECVLFDDTIWNNIKFSRPSATNKEVWKAIQFAQLDKVIEDMPRKEKTIVGERGVRLSGGEKQRVSVARAILADKKILVLDEATSALDSETEFEIQKALGKLMKGRTSIIIAHRLSTIMHADLIVVMKKGKIVEMGTHDELLALKGEYRRLWKLQKGGYIK